MLSYFSIWNNVKIANFCLNCEDVMDEYSVSVQIVCVDFVIQRFEVIRIFCSMLSRYLMLFADTNFSFF